MKLLKPKDYPDYKAAITRLTDARGHKSKVRGQELAKLRGKILGLEKEVGKVLARCERGFRGRVKAALLILEEKRDKALKGLDEANAELEAFLAEYMTKKEIQSEDN